MKVSIEAFWRGIVYNKERGGCVSVYPELTQRLEGIWLFAVQLILIRIASRNTN